MTFRLFIPPLVNERGLPTQNEIVETCDSHFGSRLTPMLWSSLLALYSSCHSFIRHSGVALVHLRLSPIRLASTLFLCVLYTPKTS